MKLAEDCPIDLKKLLHFLVEGTTGSGKSHLIRLLLEQTHGHIQQIVIDPDGEFSSLREIFDDFLILSPEGGDAVAHPGTAAILAERLSQMGASAVIDIYDLKPHERVEFVRIFCESLVNAPRANWHPILVVLDEAHMFCPETGKAESAGAVIDLATRGRKRGISLVLATQRLANLNKNAAAQMQNKAIGKTTLDIDLSRALNELGWKGKEKEAHLKSLKQGEFMIFGPAFCDEVKQIKVGAVRSWHPEAGTRAYVPPAASEKVKAMLAKGLQDLPRQAEKKAKTEEDLRAEISDLRRQLEAKGSGGISQEEHLRIVQHETGIAASRGYAEAAKEAFEVADKIRALLPAPGRSIPSFKIVEEVYHDPHDETLRNALERGRNVDPDDLREALANVGKVTDSEADREPLKKGARDILDQILARSPNGWTDLQVAMLTGFTVTGGTFQQYIGTLKRRGLIEKRGEFLFASEKARSSLSAKVHKIRSPEQMLELWNGKLKAGARRMLEIIIKNQAGIGTSLIAKQLEMEESGGTFQQYLGTLRRLQLINKTNGQYRPDPILVSR